MEEEFDSPTVYQKSSPSDSAQRARKPTDLARPSGTSNLPLVKKEHGPLVQLVRTPPCHGGGQRFEPATDRQNQYR